ncbi:MAG: UDP-N-acetylglucosamine 1-carboxyvinyltransferase [Emcibacteraceae bacterium]|nr:UDP-N-acetylglucosamine 1-carboxyvinyltransferase [Emcibacteraceae bacterium]
MDRLAITGGHRLEGQLPISGAKNAALPLMCASLLIADTLTLKNLPHLADISTLKSLLEGHGTAVQTQDKGEKVASGQIISFTTNTITSTVAPYDIVRKMRASILVLGALLARTGEATVSLPGGCAIGNRPIDLHLKGFEAMGATIELEEGYVRAVAPNGRLTGGTVVFPIVSVGATENILMAATLASGTTVIENAAREPEISDLAACLNAMGAKISGIGTRTLTVEGVPSLHGTEHSVMSDRIEAGSYAIAAAMTRGELELVGGNLMDVMTGTTNVLREAGMELIQTDHGVIAKLGADKIKGIDVTTQPFPGFPTDMQAQVMAMMTVSDSASVINEAIFENRFMHVPELTRMGADITMHGSTAIVRGVDSLLGAPVMATDLRASMSLVLAGLIADRQTFVNRIYHLDRGYSRLVEKLSAVGAVISRDAGMGI